MSGWFSVNYMNVESGNLKVESWKNMEFSEKESYYSSFTILLLDKLSLKMFSCRSKDDDIIWFALIKYIQRTILKYFVMWSKLETSCTVIGFLDLDLSFHELKHTSHFVKLQLCNFQQHALKTSTFIEDFMLFNED